MAGEKNGLGLLELSHEKKIAEIAKRINNRNAVEIFKKSASEIVLDKKTDFLDFWLEITCTMASMPLETLWNWLVYSHSLRNAADLEEFRRWAGFYRHVLSFSPNDGNWIIKNSLGVFGGMEGIRQEDRIALLDGLLDLYRLSWPASVEYFKNLPTLSRRLGIEEIILWRSRGLRLLNRDTSAGEAYFRSAEMWLWCTFGLFHHWAGWCESILARDPGAARAYLAVTPELIKTIGEERFIRVLPLWGRWILRFVEVENQLAVSFVKCSRGIIPGLSEKDIEYWAGIVLEFSHTSKKAALELVLSSETALGQLNMREYESWIRHVVKEGSPDEEKICEAVSIRTRESWKRLVSFRCGISLEVVEKTLVYFSLAYFGQKTSVKSTALLPEALFPFRGAFSTCDGQRVYLPEYINQFPGDNNKNLKLYKNLLIHELAHIIGGTYSITGEDLSQLALESGLAARAKEISGILGYLDLFDNRELIRELFEVVEDARVGELLRGKYPELAKEDFIKEAVLTAEIDAGYYNFPVSSFAELIKGLHSVKDSLRHATHWYLYIEKAGGIDKRKSNSGYSSWGGRICPELAFISANVEKEYCQTGYLNENVISQKIERQGILENNERRSSLIEYMVTLMAGFIREEDEKNFKAVADYDEWDCTLSGYRPQWVRVREILLNPSSAAFVHSTLKQYYGLASSLKRYFALMRPERFRRYRRQEDGDQEDIDAMVEAWVDKKTGMAPPAGLYIRRDKRVRDVAVSFLIDLSDSTSQKLAGGKTILDVEKESVVIMAEALQVLGDRYAIYGFNSDGRKMVNFFVVKEFLEDYNQEVKQRFGGLKSAGQTRLGAAVRHAARKLEKMKSAVRLLIVLSDGRPYDVDYCAEPETRDFSAWLKHDDLLYAQEDTRKAFSEARMRLITPFCITVDRKGKEYLEKIMGEAGYVVIDNVEILPEKLPEIYKKLTV